ncbi:tetratricopeptide TPR_4 protein [Nitrobacter winogradskyi Nb-255]|uniref:Tetratricopeptide TPR_4 protein n=1 Tax=Nitrobacter winogradskyi (strain ATCC 25391 / DSM 10237 / CIP 104748 / NCIMB 11846 / Nb-255) TaxID=323098 RepID=Q3STK2_NITWN|nr:tetratricopeptide TPR_4 protein [Nitrobacter winogradskyi Nb-255]
MILSENGFSTFRDHAPGRACARRLRRGFGPVLLTAVLLLAAFPDASRAQAVRGEASFSAADGFARLVLKLNDDVDSEVTVAGAVLVIRFKRPVDIPVGRIAVAVPDYVASARRDPDGSAIRLALARNVTVNTMTAGERVFVDLMPDGWKGPPPGLPQEVVRELAERARAAERALREQRSLEAAKKRPPVRVRASVQPTFVRYVFELPDGAGVSSALNEQKLVLLFRPALTFDLADAKLMAPANVEQIAQKVEGEGSRIDIKLIGDVDVHSFREEKNYIVDIGFQQTGKPVLPAPLASTEARPQVDAAGKAAAETPPPASRVIAERAAQKVKPSTADVKPVPAAKMSEAAPVVAATPAPVPPRIDKPVAAEATPAPEIVPSKEIASEARPADDQKARPTSVKQEPAKAAAASEPATIPALKEKIANDAATLNAERRTEGFRLTLGFGAPAPAALFRRADAVWLLFDSKQPVDINAIRKEGGSLITDIDRRPLDSGQAIRIRLTSPQLASLAPADTDAPTSAAAGRNWILTFADAVQQPSRALSAQRNVVDRAHASVTVPLAGAGRLHRIVDPDSGNALMVVTALPPARGLIRRQQFVEFSLGESIHGVVIEPKSDDIAVDVATDKVTVTRQGGLTLSAVNAAPGRASAAAQPIFDVAQWRKDSQADFLERLDELVDAASTAGDDDARAAARIDLARFYMARGFHHEARAVLDLALSETNPGQQDPVLLIIHSVASSLTNYTASAMRDLATPAIGASYDSELWKALALARQQKWAEAREKFKNAHFAISVLPLDLQRLIVTAAMRASLEVGDFSGVASHSTDLDALGIPDELKPRITVMRARLSEALGREKEALAQYREVMASSDREAATEAQIHDIALRQKRKEIKPEDALRDLETLSVMWRGDRLEVQTLKMLMALYVDAGRYAEALAVSRTATRLEPDSAMSRQIQDDASALFARLFLSTKGDNLPPVDALAMFYDFRDLTPIGRRGDEMIRRLADRLVAFDLLDQAGELLQYQVDHRLEGAARAQVAARLATIYLMNRKPDRAIAALRTTRIADLAGALRQQRLLLEARAESDIGRRDLALDIIFNLDGREAIRLRSDIYWASRRWREASEQVELYYGERWRDLTPLTQDEKSDIIRAVIGYALSEDVLGLARFREKYAPLMNGGADKLAFDTASKPAASNSAEFEQIARMAAKVNTLSGFLRDMNSRFSGASANAPPPEEAETDPSPTGTLRQIVGSKRVEASR